MQYTTTQRKFCMSQSCSHLLLMASEVSIAALEPQNHGLVPQCAWAG